VEIDRPYPTGGTGGGVRWGAVTREWLLKEYVEADKSAKQIADEIGSTGHTVWVWLRKFGIPTRTRRETNKRHSERMSGNGNPAWNGGTARNYHHNALAKSGRSRACEWCGHDQDLQVHHRDHDKYNGDLANLAWLCGPCNRLEAQLWQLEAEGRATMTLEDGRLIIAFRTKEN